MGFRRFVVREGRFFFVVGIVSRSFVFRRRFSSFGGVISFVVIVFILVFVVIGDGVVGFALFISFVLFFYRKLVFFRN